MPKNSRNSNKLLRTWFCAKITFSRFPLLNLAIICLLPLLISGFIFFQSIPSNPPNQKRFTWPNIKDFIEIAGIEIALVALLHTAFSVYSEHQRQKKLCSSQFIEQWHKEMKDCVSITRQLKDSLNEKNLRLQITESELEKLNKNPTEKRYNLLKERAKIFNEIEKICTGIAQEKRLKKIIDSPNKEDVSNQEKKEFQEEKELPLRDYLNEVLNFFEQMSEAVKFGIADESLLKDFFYYIVVQHYEALRYILNIVRWRRAKADLEYLLLYSNFQDLALRWIEQGPPSAPYKSPRHILDKSRKSTHSSILTEFEDSIMTKLLKGVEDIPNEGNDILNNLRQQYNEKLVVQSRQEYGAGFFLYFKEKDREKTSKVEPENFQIDDVYFEIKDMSFGGRAILYVKDGFLSYLEVYLYTDEWINNYKIIDSNITLIYYDSGKERDLKKQVEKWNKC